MSTLITGIGELVTNDLQPGREGGPLGIVREAAVLIEDGRVAWVGEASEVPDGGAREVVDLGGLAVIPGFVDSHTHLVFAGDRAPEFEARMAGRSYAAGGIRTTVSATRDATEEALRGRLAGLVAEARAQGTTTLEVKSGYGLDVGHEERLVRLAAEVTDEVTFLGAHVVPLEHVSDQIGRASCRERV